MLFVTGIVLMVLPAAVILLTIFMTVFTAVFAPILTSILAAVLTSRRLVRLARVRGGRKQGAGDEQGSTQLCESCHNALLDDGATAGWPSLAR